MIAIETRVHRKLLLSALYAVAMAYVESAVVVYLRLVVNHGRRLFPLTPLPPHLLHIELGREFATIVMLAAVALLQTRNRRVAIGLFVFCFGIWDIFYYVWLWVFIGWPTSLVSWDVLFLIPVPWFGPVLSPSLVSLLFIIGGVLVVHFEGAATPLRFRLVDWVAIVLGTLAIIGSYVWELPTVARTGMPVYYPWWLFAIGLALWTATLARLLVGARRSATRRGPGLVDQERRTPLR